MAINLTKGGNVSLTSEAPGLAVTHVGLGWDAQSSNGEEYDLDASVIMVGADGKGLSADHFIYFNNLKSPDGSVVHTGDNLTGEGDGDDELVKVQLDAVPLECDKIVFAVAIYEADQRKQNFGQVSNAFIRIVDGASSTEIVRYDLSEDFSMETAIVFGELYRRGAEWKFRAMGQGYTSGLGEILAAYGI